jgi:hypothetical protein
MVINRNTSYDPQQLVGKERTIRKPLGIYEITSSIRRLLYRIRILPASNVKGSELRTITPLPAGARAKLIYMPTQEQMERNPTGPIEISSANRRELTTIFDFGDAI